MTGMSFPCGACGTPVVMGDNAAAYSVDMMKQSYAKKCTACWRKGELPAKEGLGGGSSDAMLFTATGTFALPSQYRRFKIIISAPRKKTVRMAYCRPCNAFTLEGESHLCAFDISMVRQHGDETTDGNA